MLLAAGVQLKDDASLSRILNYPARGIGKTTIEKLGTAAFERGKPFFEALADAPGLALRGSEGCMGLRDLILELRTQLEATPHARAALALGAPLARDDRDQARARAGGRGSRRPGAKWESVEELVHSLGQLDPADFDRPELTSVQLLQEFLARMTLDANEAEEDKKDRETSKRGTRSRCSRFMAPKGWSIPSSSSWGWRRGSSPISARSRRPPTSARSGGLLRGHHARARSSRPHARQDPHPLRQARAPPSQPVSRGHPQRVDPHAGRVPFARPVQQGSARRA